MFKSYPRLGAESVQPPPLELFPSEFTAQAMQMPNDGVLAPFSFVGREYLLPIYDTPHPRVLLCFGRQSEKSTTLGNKILALSCLRHHFNSLFVSPSQQQTEVFSRDKLSSPLELSEMLRTFLNRNMNNVLYKKFVTGSSITLRYAFLHADRCRGIPADHLLVDECNRCGTLIDTPTGKKPIEEFQPGDAIVSFDEEGALYADEVTNCRDRGIRDCFRLELEGGASLDLTSEAWVATTEGWKRTSEIIQEIGDAFHVDLRAGADVARDDVGRRQHGHAGQEPPVPQPARLGAERLQLPKVPGPLGVRTYATREAKERGLRRVAELLAHADLSGALAYSFLVPPQRQEAGDAGVAGPADLGRGGVVVPGRRQPVRADRDLPHRGLQSGGGRVVGPGPASARARRDGAASGVTAQPRQDLLPHRAVDRIDLPARSGDRTVRLPRDAVQARPARAHPAYLPLVRRLIRAARGLHQGEVRRAEGASVLWGAGLPETTAPGRSQQVRLRTGESHQEERADPAALPRRSGQPAGARPSQGRGGESGRSGPRQGGEGPVSGETAGSPAADALDVPEVRAQRAAGRSSQQDPVLPGVSGGGNPRGQAAASSPPHRLEPRSLRRVSWVGRHRVFDLEVKQHSTFIAGGMAIHNCQDILTDVLPIIEECLSHSSHKLMTYSGTPKSLDNTISYYWNTFSTMCEWMIPCDHCGGGDYRHWNTIGYDNIGPVGLICSRCKKDIQARHPDAEWVSQRSMSWLKSPPDGIPFEGYRIPQLLTSWVDWPGVLDKKRRYPLAQFYNEVLALGYDSGEKLLTREALQKSSVPNCAMATAQGYAQQTTFYMGIDWGGGGGGTSEDAPKAARSMSNLNSYTVVTIGGYMGGKFQYVYFNRFEGPEAAIGELIPLIIKLVGQFNVAMIGTDYGGGLDKNDLLIRHFGIRRVARYQYCNAKMIHFNRDLHHWMVNRTEALMALINAINRGNELLFPRWEDWEFPYAQDMLSVFKEYNSSNTQMVVTKTPGTADDSLHAALYCLLVSMIQHPRPDILAADLSQ